MHKKVISIVSIIILISLMTVVIVNIFTPKEKGVWVADGSQKIYINSNKIIRPYYLEIDGKGNYKLDMKNYIEKGTYSINNNEIIFKDENGLITELCILEDKNKLVCENYAEYYIKK